MEFVGNQINAKTVLTTVITAAFVGRINLFEGTFPATIAFVTVMMAVSTVYIYLLPIIIGAIFTYFGEGLLCYGDVMAVIFCGLFFLFFHTHKFSINQRTAVAVAAVITFNYIYYAYGEILYMLNLGTLIKEVLAVIVFVRVFNTVAKVIFVGTNPVNISEEKIWLAYEIFFISLGGAINVPQVVFPIWVLMIATVLYCKGVQPAMSMTGIAAVYWYCQNAEDLTIFITLLAGLLAGWFLASLVEGKYRKTVLGIILFIVIAVSASQQVYGGAAAMAIFIAIPSNILVHLWCVGKERFSPNIKTGADIKLENIKTSLQQKRETFDSLGKMYSGAMDKRQIISYQFEGMARAVDKMLRNIQESSGEISRQSPIAFNVATASYAFEKVSGDSSISFTFGKENQALIISDGMGKGEKAATESKLVVNTMSKLLSAGFDVDLAMKTINAILMTGNKAEMFATVDLAILNTRTNRAKIFKMGAASTFVKHNGKVYMLKRPALPVGIVEGLKLEYIDVKLKKGDLLIMVSDGVTDCDRQDPECLWLQKRLEEIGSKDPDTVAELIVNKAAEKYQLRERDDLTVLVTAI